MSDHHEELDTTSTCRPEALARLAWYADGLLMYSGPDPEWFEPEDAKAAIECVGRMETRMAEQDAEIDRLRALVRQARPAVEAKMDCLDSEISRITLNCGNADSFRETQEEREEWDAWEEWRLDAEQVGGDDE
jgi:hypothetical protein